MVWKAMQALVLDNERRKQVCESLGMSFIRIKAVRHLSAGLVALTPAGEGVAERAEAIPGHPPPSLASLSRTELETLRSLVPRLSG